MSTDPRFIVISGLSGSGKSTAVKAFEDTGAYCVDNLPTALMPRMLELFEGSTLDLDLVVLVMDIRERRFISEFPELFRNLRSTGVPVSLLFITADEKILVRRFSETRRAHPLGNDGSLLDAIRQESQELEPLRELADRIIDTSGTTIRELREEIKKIALETKFRSERELKVTILTFGYKYGLPFEVDLAFDVRFLPNPYFVEGLRHRTGLDGEVRDFVLAKEETGAFLDALHHYLEAVLPAYRSEGRPYLTIGIGCTGGRHRSVAIAGQTAAFIEKLGYAVQIKHRDIRQG
jgi:UPF0042 nucleotide-binding protein